MTSNFYRLAPIDPVHADVLRSAGGVIHVADSKPGYPCRQCLRDANVGEELVLVAHDPFEVDSPYRSTFPIFLHRLPCEPPASTESLPVQLTGRQLSVRAYDHSSMMIDAAVVEGHQLETTLQTFFDNAETDTIHIHNAPQGCWAAAVKRS